MIKNQIISFKVCKPLKKLVNRDQAEFSSSFKLGEIVKNSFACKNSLAGKLLVFLKDFWNSRFFQ